jgi:hypothetical protein
MMDLVDLYPRHPFGAMIFAPLCVSTLYYKKWIPNKDAIARFAQYLSSKKIQAGRSKGISSSEVGGELMLGDVYTGSR